MKRSLEVLLAPAEYALLPARDLSQTVCVVLDILRATTTMMTALANGAARILPVADIDEALDLRRRHPDVLLAGERNGLRIRAGQSGGVDFDLGNSPREFGPEQVRGRTIVMTTTNGTRALKACAAAAQVLIGSLAGLRALAGWLESKQPQNLIIVCSGTADQVSYEDTLAAGALCELIGPVYSAGAMADSVHIALQIYRAAQGDLLSAMRFARNGRRLLEHPDLQGDVPVCLRRDTLDLVAGLVGGGAVERLT